MLGGNVGLVVLAGDAETLLHHGDDRGGEGELRGVCGLGSCGIGPVGGRLGRGGVVPTRCLGGLRSRDGLGRTVGSRGGGLLQLRQDVLVRDLKLTKGFCGDAGVFFRHGQEQMLRADFLGAERDGLLFGQGHDLARAVGESI